VTDDDLTGTLDFLARAEALKDTLRTGRTSTGRRESTAEHSWRLCLMALVLGEQFAGADAARVLRICLVHDLAEALTGDLPASAAGDAERPGKVARERAALATLTAPLPDGPRAAIRALWEEYEAGATREAQLAKGLDKLETLLQHAQGQAAPDFDFAFNLGYGRAATEGDPLLAALRRRLDAATRARMAAPNGVTAPP